MVSFYGILRKPVITKKSLAAIKMRKVCIIVSKDSSKKKIKAAIKTIFNINVKKVGIINTHGKKKRLGRFVGRTKSVKKAIVSFSQQSDVDKFLVVEKK